MTVRSQSPCMLLRSAALEYVPLFAKRRRRSPLIRMPNLATLAAIDSGRPSHHFCFRISTRSITFPILHSPYIDRHFGALVNILPRQQKLESICLTGEVGHIELQLLRPQGGRPLFDPRLHRTPVPNPERHDFRKTVP